MPQRQPQPLLPEIPEPTDYTLAGGIQENKILAGWDSAINRLKSAVDQVALVDSPMVSPNKVAAAVSKIYAAHSSGVGAPAAAAPAGGLMDVGNGQKLEANAAKAFLAAQAELRRMGINIRAGSGYRSFEHQKEMRRKYEARGRRGPPVAKPETSLHVKGLAVDIQGYNSKNIGTIQRVMAKHGFQQFSP